MAKKYTAAVVGAGSGGRLSMAALDVSDRYDLVAVADFSADARRIAQTDYPGLQTFATHSELFAACPTDVVCVSTWPPSHLDVTRAALELSLTGILVEKPLGDTTVAGQTILDLVRAQRLPLAVPHGLLVANHSRAILDLVHSGAIGALKLMEIECRGWDIINAGIHWLNFFVMLTGREAVASVMATYDSSTRTYRDGMQVETVAITYAQTRSGVRVVMQTGDEIETAEPDKAMLFRLLGDQGAIEFYGWESCYRLVNADYPQGRHFDVEPGPISNHQRHLDTLATQMDAGQPDYAVAESSLMALELCEAAYRAAALGCLVTLPLDQFTPTASTGWTPGAPYSGQGGGRDGRRL